MENTINWNFDNSYSRLSDAFKEHIKPVAVKNPELVIINESLAKELDLDLTKINKDKLSSLFTGNTLPEGSNTIAQAYAGHQFGHFTMLGDGRAILIGEHITNGNKRFDIQLKGSGKTAFSRQGDGRSPLGPVIREYVVSEALHYLGLRSTRSLAIVSTGETVLRETPTKGGILTRVASSHIRIGTFEFFFFQKDFKSLKKLADYTINRHFRDFKQNNPYEFLLEKVIKLQASW